MKKIYLFLILNALTSLSFIAKAQSINLIGPAGSGQFGTNVIVLTNGNYVVTDPFFDDGAITDVGAVYLYNGSTHTLISTLKGSTANDRVGNNGITALNNGNYVVCSSNWNNGAINGVGAVTWCNGTSGISGLVSSSNSLVGSQANDYVGTGGNITQLANGNYVVVSSNWKNGAIATAGAVTLCKGNTGLSGAVSSSNSLVGSTAGDYVGSPGITALINGNYVVRSTRWHNGAEMEAGAVTWGSGSAGITGTVSSSNSLVGSTAFDQVGNGNITPLSNGNYIVISSNWAYSSGLFNAGAVTWGNGNTGISGVVNSSNSLVSSTNQSFLGNGGITILSNGNYVVASSLWKNGAIAQAGAVTWGNKNSGVSGIVSSSNSLVGSKLNDQVGKSGLTALANGNYVVSSGYWDNGIIVDAGAATWGNGISGVSGVVSSSNSLVGDKSNDNVAFIGITALSNGNYVVKSIFWDNGAVLNVGAVTWGNGNTGISGIVTSSNSLVGSTANDQVGNIVTALSNGNYIVRSDNWDNGAIVNAGAATWGNGSSGTSGVVSSSNSLVGSTASDMVGNFGIYVLPNGNYLVNSGLWDNGSIVDAGAITWGNGANGVSGVVSSSNSLVGSTASDQVGNSSFVVLNNGNYLISTVTWDNGAIIDAGAVTWGNGNSGLTGIISNSNSLVGNTASDKVGNFGITALSNGNYLVKSATWDNGSIVDAGAVTWGYGASGVSGVISSSNSLVGSSTNDQIGRSGTTALSNGNYIVLSSIWDNGAIIDAGAITWGIGSSGVSGVVSMSNSLVGTSANDQVGNSGITIFSNGNYIINSTLWDNGAIPNAGAVTLGNSSIGIAGSITTCNSVLGGLAFGGSSIGSIYNSVFDYLIVSRREENIVTIYNAAGMSLANSLDAITVNVNGTNAVPLIASAGCRIIATLTPNGGGSAVSGIVNAKVWIEPSVPSQIGQPFVARHYEITPTTDAATSTGKITLYFTQQEFDDFNAHPGSFLDLPTNGTDIAGKANLRIGKYPGSSSDDSGMPFSYSGTAEVIDPANADIIWNAGLNRWEVSFDVTGFSGFIVQTRSVVLPLTLLEFTGKLLNDDAVLKWKTDNEQNSSHFDIERSIDGRNFSLIGNIKAANTAGVHQYEFIDNKISSLGAPVIYYRLKQLDIDGRFVYSKIIALSPENRNIVLLYPNPVINEVSLALTLTKSGPIQLSIIDNLGRRIKQQQLNVTAGANAISVDVSNLLKGIYFLELKGININERKQFVK